MIARILANLTRQMRAVELLQELQKEEFSHLAVRDAGGVASVEFSIQELLRQIGGERHSLHVLYAGLDPAARRLADVIDRFPAEAAAEARALFVAIDAVEQRCAKQASRNYAMALGLYDVAKSGLDSLRSLLTPKRGVYGASGRLRVGATGPVLLHGRL